LAGYSVEIAFDHEGHEGSKQGILFISLVPSPLGERVRVRGEEIFFERFGKLRPLVGELHSSNTFWILSAPGITRRYTVSS
jgi:hypothetical protein